MKELQRGYKNICRTIKESLGNVVSDCLCGDERGLCWKTAQVTGSTWVGAGPALASLFCLQSLVQMQRHCGTGKRP